MRIATTLAPKATERSAIARAALSGIAAIIGGASSAGGSIAQGTIGVEAGGWWLVAGGWRPAGRGGRPRRAGLESAFDEVGEEGGAVELFEALRNRRSIRKYADRPVPDELLEQVLEAARCAPSWANVQPWRFVVVTDPETRRALAETLPSNNPGKGAILGAPVLLAACGVKQTSGYYKGKVTTTLGDWLMFDLALALGQLTLAAHALGLGTLHVGLYDIERASAVLGLPADVQLVELVPMGYPDQTPNSPPRKPLAEIVHRGKWGSPYSKTIPA
ncbi:MAG: nitroreductase family protein [Deltaproteobacteria bacterium]|nr:nitroreductase family protein [Deltaproteobacteria bacterium]